MLTKTYKNTHYSAVILVYVWLLIHSVTGDCPKRAVLTADSGTISLSHEDYSFNTYCQWLIKGNGSKFINLYFDNFLTECDYDYLYVYDGDSFSSRLLGSFSGATLPDELSASSGSALIQFYSDLNFKPDQGSFNLRYTITECKHGCSPCSNRRCVCPSTQLTGLDCSVEMCSSGADCNNHGTCVREPTDGRKYCACEQGYAGRKCDLELSGPVSSQGLWLELAPSDAGFESRTGHSAVYDEDTHSIWSFGGYSLASVMNQLKRFNLTNSRWEIEPIIAGVDWPSPSYNHRAVEADGCMYVTGGRNDTTILNQFWRFCFLNTTWTQLSDLPEGLSDHSLTLVDGRWLYIVGGLTSSQVFSSNLLRYNIYSDSGGLWEDVAVRGGKSLDVRVAAHSTVFHVDSRALVIFGGHRPNIARFSEHTRQVWMFLVDEQGWSHVHYPNSNPQLHPNPTAYHTANVVGNYMLVYGGQTKRFHSQSCISNALYAYHLICHRWVDIGEMYEGLGLTEPTQTPDAKGRHSHASVLINGNLMVVLGGFRGSALGDIWSYQVLSTIARNTADASHGSMNCDYQEQGACVNDPECHWCPSLPYSGCSSRANSCSSPYYDCPGLCQALLDCQSCVMLSGNATYPAYPNLGQREACAWCIHDRTCMSQSELTGTCQSPPAQPVGWWLGGPTKAVHQSECIGSSPAGVRFAVYLSPTDYSLPDKVIYTDVTKMEWSSGQNDGLDRSVARFYLHPNNVTANDINLKLEVQNNDANVTIDYNNQEISSGHLTFTGVSALTVVLENSVDPTKSVLPNVARGERYLVQFDAISSPSTDAIYRLLWNAISGTSYRQIDKTYLESYSNGDCSNLRSCLSCQLDVACGWCPIINQCVSRSNATLTSAECGTDNPEHWLVTDIDLCGVCSDHTDCQECVETDVCEWNTEKLSCDRLGLETDITKAVFNTSVCPSRCNQRSNCSECLSHGDECIWCESTQTCDQFAPYLVANSYGQCKAWKEGHLHTGICTPCESFSSCSDCLGQSGCGWCGNDFNPNIGVCTSGDYSSSTNCSATLHSVLNVAEELLALNLSLSLLNPSNVGELSTNASFSYETCPDVLECTLGLAVCHENSTCVNTPETYECRCNQGFEGNGKVSTCIKTCFYPCENGVCSGHPEYECICDLGWTNTTCDIDCGCNNHSTCVNGTGTCDLCQEMSYGEHCEFCLPGSYGNATVAPGCLPCACNEHSIASLNHCDTDTGVCYCQDGFLGDHCEICGLLSTGDPRDGQTCYAFSHRRLVILNATGLNGITSEGKYHDVSYTQWVISPFGDLDTVHTPTGTPLMTVTIDSVNTTCPLGYVYVYDGVGYDDSLGYKAAFCGSTDTIDPSANSVDIYSGYATIIYYGNSTEDESFTARYVVHQCNDSCLGNRACDVNNECQCIVGNGGTNCEKEFCPNNCSSHGYCNQNTLSCFCDEGYSGEDCRMDSYITVNRLVQGRLTPVSPSPRRGFTVVDCGSEGYILFGGFSTQSGMLNDLWRFDGLTWTEITPASANRPPGRYLHAAVCIDDTHMIIHGGLVMSSENATSPPITDGEVWAFYFDNWMWVNKVLWTHDSGTRNMTVGQDLAGHTLTQVSYAKVLVTGGYSTISDWNNETYIYNDVDYTWNLSPSTGAVPAGLMMHTSIYHNSSNALYIHGGYRYYIDKMFPSNDTFFYDVSAHRWYKRPNDYGVQTTRRYRHSAVQIRDWMLVMGGLKSEYKDELSMSLYSYSCDRWHDVGVLPSPRAELVSLINGSTVYMFSSSRDSLSVDTLTVPEDVCTLYSGSSASSCLSQKGCHACNDSGVFHCFDKRLLTPTACSGVNDTGRILTTNDSCGASLAHDRECKAYKDCAQCLTAWPYHGVIAQKCKWCSFCNVGMCINKNLSCAEENVCPRPQSERFSAEECVEQRCRSATCSQCRTETQDKDGCIWTRQFMRSSEVGRQVAAQPFENWNCVTKLLINLSVIQVWSAPPHVCPAPCQSFTDCRTCLNSDGGGSGGTAVCYWSSNLQLCMPPTALPLVCDTAICAPLFKSGDDSQCPLPCFNYTQCGLCLSQPHCGWCSEGPDGEGACMGGVDTGPTSGICNGVMNSNKSSNILRSWNFLQCPLENECNNTHHTCDLEKEDCLDLELGYHCTCKDGYKLIDRFCIPQCNSGCLHGECVKPEICRCDFSYVGANCSVPCECNQHSDCVGPQATNNCTNCLNNTMGDQCEICDKLAVGNATNGGACEDCFTVCNNHANVCMDNSTLAELVLKPNQTITEAYLEFVRHGPSSHKDVVCIGCANNTAGEKCSTCLPGFFRRETDPTMACEPCRCQGHGFTCHPNTGANCECYNNTLSTACTSGSGCHLQQCNQCVDEYVGRPTDGHQCYLRLTSEIHNCISRKDCSERVALPFGQATMVAVQPKFLNVDIKIYLNVEYGEVDVYLSKSDEIFVIEWDADTQQHTVSIDPKYTIMPDRRKRDLVDVMSRARRDATNNTLTQYFIEPELDPDAEANYIDARSHDRTFDSIYYIKGLKKRLVITLPEGEHELRKDKFYIVLVSRGRTGTFGTLVFRQDQIRIELFVFFAVFFSCFFKFLSICVIVWKFKSLYQQQQQRIQRAVELGQMASRPFATSFVVFEDTDLPPPLKCKRRTQLNPAAFEFAEDGVAVVGTVMIQMAGGKQAPVRAMFGSALMTLRVLYPNRKTVIERHKEADRLKTTPI